MKNKLLAVFIVILLPWLAQAQKEGDSWNDILENKSGDVVFYWYPNNIRLDRSKDILDGVEYDLAQSFVQYLNDKYNLDISLTWILTSSFDDVMDTVRSAGPGTFGASSISITEERKEYLNFSPPYLSDVAVLISSPGVPLAHTTGEFDAIFNDLTAVSIPNTTLDVALNELKQNKNLHFDTKYVSNSGEIIDEIESSDNAFGYIDLPNFLVAFDNATKVRRQFFYPIKLEGLGMIFPLSSDWNEPVNDYFTSDEFLKDKQRIIGKYFGKEVMDVVDRVAKSAELGPLEEIVISTREREFQYEELLEASNREKERIRINNALLIAFITAAFILLILYINYQIKSRANEKLQNQQETIENRNAQLQTLNEEKNDLIRILAHDLRSPISNIAGCADLLKESKNLDKDGEKMVDFISQSSEKIESMIAKILDVDAIDSGDHNLKLEELEIDEIIHKIIHENNEKALTKKISIVTLGLDHFKVKGDRFYIGQIIENLLSNAIKFSDKKTEITIETKSKRGVVQVAVKDQGPGLTEDDKKRVFKKYQVLSATPTGGESSIGIGLSIVKLYAEMMGGDVSFESELGKGTNFYVELPKA